MNSKQVPRSPANGDKLICPWQLGPLIDNFLRPLIHNPRKLFGPYVKTGMTVLDVGCGAGFASLGLADLVGDEGLVISADLQPEMLDMVKKRVARAGLGNRIRVHRCDCNRIGVEEELDFAVAFFMLHEVTDAGAFLEEIYTLLRPGGRLFLTEPIVHVSRRNFEQMVQEAQAIGFTVSERPSVRFGMTVLLVKDGVG
jgi:ubiquinone/menaquinone biosynthesis C-methylase UbiE